MRLLFILFFAFSLNLSFADSPLTSTGFSTAYKDNSMVKEALNSDGQLSENFCSYLHNKKNSLEEKMAVINALSWKFEGKSNFQTFLKYLDKHGKKVTVENYKKTCSGEELLCLSYLKALDNYFKVDEALELAELAKNKLKKSFTANIIFALIKAQKAMDSNWCEVWMVCSDVKNNKKLKSDMNQEAVDIIFDYIGLYKSSCK